MVGRVRRGPVNVRPMSDFLGNGGARRAGNRHGSIASVLQYLLKRAARDTKNNDTAWLQGLSDRRSLLGYKRRSYSGLGPWPTIPDLELQRVFLREARLKIPRTYMGRSTFSFGKLVKAVRRQGL